MPDRRRRDLDNLQKAAFDALTKAGFWLDDIQVVDYRVVKIAGYQRWEAGADHHRTGR